MNHRRLLLIIGFSVFLASALADSAQADAGLQINDMYVAVWPEYDTPQVLVQYEGHFADATVFPRRVSFLIPSGALMDATCALDASGKHTKIPFEEQAEPDGWTRVSYNLTTAAFHLDFYYNAFQGNTARDFTYRFRATYPAQSVQLEVQEPSRSSAFRLVPAAQTMNQDNQGFKYHRSRFVNVEPDKPIDVRISYVKSDSQPSVTIANEPALVRREKPIQWLPDMPLLLTTLAGAGAMMLFALWFTSRRTRQPHPALVRPPGHGTYGAAWRGGYCTACGAVLMAEDRFCPECGEQRYRPVGDK